MARFIIGGAAIGLVIPLIILTLHYLRPSQYISDYLVIILWPSSFMTMATEGASPIVATFTVALSVAINIGLYALIGALIGWVRILTK